jgi:hypothetical protein
MTSLANQLQVSPSSDEEAMQKANEEQCEVVNGGAGDTPLMKEWKKLRRTQSAPERLQNNPFRKVPRTSGVFSFL